MDKIIGALSGAPGAAANTGGYYQNALNNEVNLTGTGSPVATTFGNQEVAALQPQFNTQDQALAAKEAAMGITSSGAGKADFTQLGADQSATLAGAIAPLYSGAANAYSGINAAQPGAQAGSYQQAINNFYAGLSDAGSAIAGIPPSATPAQAQSPAGSVIDPNTGSTTSPSGVSTIDNPTEMYSPDFNPYANVSIAAPSNGGFPFGGPGG